MPEVVSAEVVNDRAKLIMHRLVARRLAREPQLIAAARDVLERQPPEQRRFGYYEEWNQLLKMNALALSRRIVQRDELMTILRKCSPFGIARGVDFTDIDFRRRIWRKAKRA